MIWPWNGYRTTELFLSVTGLQLFSQLLIDQMAEVHPLLGFELFIKCHRFFLNMMQFFLNLIIHNLITISSILNTNIIIYIHVYIEERNGSYYLCYRENLPTQRHILCHTDQ